MKHHEGEFVGVRGTDIRYQCWLPERKPHASLLIVHGLLDPFVPPMQSEELVESLRREGKTYEFKSYFDKGHGILRRKNLLDFYARMERFLDWYLL